MQGRLSIGDFSRVTHVSVKTLRRYHESGLLEPAEIDPRSGYRYYQLGQIPVAQTIRRFRDLGMPVREIGELLVAADTDARSALIAAHLVRLEVQLAQTQSAVSSLRRLARSGQTPSGPPGGLYDNDLFTDELGDMLVFVPVPNPPEAGRVGPETIGPTDLAVTVHRGNHDDIDVTYGALGIWVDQHALAISGPVHEIYLVRPRDTADESAWRTEIGWPVASS